MSEAINSPEAKSRRFRPYPKYKDSGVEWLGEIPIAWNLMKLKRFVQFLGGGTPSKDNLEYWQGDIPWVSPKDMKSRIISDTVDKITEEAVAESATKVIGRGAVLIVVRSGILNHSIPVALSSTEVALNQDLKALIVDKSAVPEYLAYFIVGMQSMLLFAWRKEGATVESLELELIANTVIPLPATEQQRIIVGFLDRETAKIDTLIEKKERLIDLLQEKRTALITQAVTKGLDPNVPMKDSGVEWLGKIPAHWEAFRMKFLVKEPLKYGANEAAESLDVDLPRYVRITDISEDGLLQEETFRSLPFEIAAPYLLEEGDILFARSGATVGKTFCYNPSWGVAAYAGYLIRARLDKSRIDPRFILYFTRSTLYWDWIRRNFIQATIQNVSAERYANLIIPSPPQMDQYAIMKYLDQETEKMDTLITKIHKAIDRLKEYRAALISAAVTGRIDVRDENV